MRNLQQLPVLRSLLVILLALPAIAGAQIDTTRRPPPPPARVSTTPAVDSFKPPISPRRAFFYSFLLPGYSQSRLGRHKAGATFMLVEAIALGMIRESAADAHEARRLVGDSLIVSYVDPSGNAAITRGPARFDDNYIRTREAHVEDWVALLVANHLFAGADAFVAAHLWDIPARLGFRVVPHGGVLSASLKW
jgi:hypothetical protein